MIKSTKRLVLLFFSLLAGSAIFFSCTDVDKTLGLGLVPDDERRDFKIDTIYPEAYTVTIDSVYTHSPSTFMIGTYYDPMFGLTTAGSAFQILPAYDTVDYGVNPTYESLTLSLVLNAAPIGNSTAAQRISVYELKERIYYDSAYYAATPVQDMIEANPIATTTYNGEDTLKIELGPTFANKLLNAPEEVFRFDQDTLYNSKFFDYLKGFYIKTDPIGGGNERMNFFEPTINMHLVYSNADTTNATSLYHNIYSYDYNGNEYYFSQFNTVTRDYDQADPVQKIIYPVGDTTRLDSVLYIQGFFGATPYIKITADKLNTWLQNVNLEADQAGIVRAELIMELEEFNGFDITKYPGALGGMTLLNPLTVYNSYYGSMYMGGCLTSFYYALSAFDGKLNPSLKKYSFNITHEIIEQLRKNTDLRFYLAPYTSNSGEVSYNTLLYNLGPNQYQDYKAVMRGPAHSKPLKLVISYAIPQ